MRQSAARTSSTTATRIWALDIKSPRTTNHTIELFGGYVNDGPGHAGTLDHGPSRAPLHANLGFAGLAYTGEFADMITVKVEFSGIFGRVDLSLGERATLGSGL